MLVEADFTVYAVARDAATIAREYRAEVVAGLVQPTALEIADAGAVDDFHKSVFADVPLDLPFNNAGRFESLAPVWDADAETWWGT